MQVVFNNETKDVHLGGHTYILAPDRCEVWIDGKHDADVFDLNETNATVADIADPPENFEVHKFTCENGQLIPKP